MVKYPNSKTDLRPQVWCQLQAVHFLKGTAFSCFLRCQCLSCNCCSAMAKSADNDARPLTFLTSITDLASVIGDYFKECCMYDHKDYLKGGLPGSRYM